MSFESVAQAAIRNIKARASRVLISDIIVRVIDREQATIFSISVGGIYGFEISYYVWEVFWGGLPITKLLFSIFLISSVGFARDGAFEVKYTCGALIAAPHGGFDYNTEHIARDVAQQLQWSYLVAVGFRSFANPINVNRPTKGVRVGADGEFHTHDALLVFRQYQKHVQDIRPNYYVEIHGAEFIQDRIEIAVNGIDAGQAKQIKLVFEEESARLNLNIEIAIEGVDKIQYTAIGAKRWGVLGQVSPAMHIELSPQLRENNLAPTVALLTKSLDRIIGEILR